MSRHRKSSDAHRTAVQLAGLKRRTVLFDPRTVERREGYYIGTDQPLTDEYGLARNRTGSLMFYSEITERDRRAGFAYFIQHEEGGPIKIGKSCDPERRCRDLNVNSHDPRYRLLAVVAGYGAAEANLHLQFRHLRLHGEWFDPTDELLEHIDGLEAWDA